MFEARLRRAGRLEMLPRLKYKYFGPLVDRIELRKKFRLRRASNALFERVATTENRNHHANTQSIGLNYLRKYVSEEARYWVLYAPPPRPPYPGFLGN